MLVINTFSIQEKHVFAKYFFFHIIDIYKYLHSYVRTSIHLLKRNNLSNQIGSKGIRAYFFQKEDSETWIRNLGTKRRSPIKSTETSDDENTSHSRKEIDFSKFLWNKKNSIHNVYIHFGFYLFSSHICSERKKWTVVILFPLLTEKTHSEDNKNSVISLHLITKNRTAFLSRFYFDRFPISLTGVFAIIESIRDIGSCQIP